MIIKAMFRCYFFSLWSCFVVIIPFLISCNDSGDDQSGQVIFSFDQTNSSIIITDSTLNATSVIVTIADKFGNTFLGEEKLFLTESQQVRVTSSIALPPGEYTLTKFFVLNSSNKVLYASPVEGANLSYLVNSPLPLRFVISSGYTTNIAPEILAVEDQTPIEFGYAYFGFGLTKTFDFNLSVFIYMQEKGKLEFSDANIEISSFSTILYNKNIEPEVSLIRLIDGYPNYTLKITRSGYQKFCQSYSSDSLKKYLTSPLKVILQDSSLQNALIGWYTFDYNSNDRSGHNNHGYAVGLNYTADRNGQPNSAVSFSGMENYIEFTQKEILNLQKGAIAFWIKINVIGSNREIFNLEDSYLNTKFSFRPTSNKQLGIFSSNNSISGSKIIEQGKYYHIVLQSNGSSYSLYINGTKDELQILAGSNSGLWFGDFPNQKRLYFGTLNAIPFLNAVIDEISIYNRQLTEYEIELLNMQ